MARKVPVTGKINEFPGGSFNELIDGLNQKPGATKQHGNSGYSGYVIVAVTNNSGGDLEPGNLLGINDLLYSPDDRASAFYENPVFDCGTPAVPNHSDNFVILKHAVANGETKTAAGILLGPAHVYVDVTDTGHNFAKVANGDAAKMVSHASEGFAIVWKETGTGTKKALILKLSGGASGTEQPRMIRAVVKGTVTPQADTFTVDGILVLAGGLDPRSTPGDPAEELTVFKDPSNTWHEDLYDNEEVVCVYHPEATTGVDWELLFVERFREIQFQAVGAVGTGDSPFDGDNIVTLLSGRDPRTDPTSGSEAIDIYNVHSQSYTDNEVGYAVWNCSAAQWQARKKSASGSSLLSLARVYTEIGPMTPDGADIGPGDGLVKYFTRPGTPGDPWVFVDDPQTAYNNGLDPIEVDKLVWIDSEGYVVSEFCTPAPAEE